jgi:hypothetical protein
MSSNQIIKRMENGWVLLEKQKPKMSVGHASSRRHRLSRPLAKKIIVASPASK